MSKMDDIKQIEALCAEIGQLELKKDSIRPRFAEIDKEIRRYIRDVTWWAEASSPNVTTDNLVALFLRRGSDDYISKLRAEDRVLTTDFTAACERSKKASEELLALVQKLGVARDHQLLAAYEKLVSEIQKIIFPACDGDEEAADFAPVFNRPRQLHARIGAWNSGSGARGKARILLDELKNPITLN